MKLLALLILLVAASLPVAPGAAATPRAESANDTTFSAYQFRQGWLSRDKAYHLTVSGMGAAGLYALGRELGLGRLPSAVGASLLMGTAGLLRESYDADDPHLLNRSAFSRKDMTWNLVGIAIGISVTDLALRGRGRKDRQSTSRL